jgi:hypothetical protein
MHQIGVSGSSQSTSQGRPPLCDPRILSPTKCGNTNGSSALPTAGDPIWQRNSKSESSLPIYRPAMNDMVVLAESQAFAEPELSGARSLMRPEEL